MANIGFTSEMHADFKQFIVEDSLLCSPWLVIAVVLTLLLDKSLKVCSLAWCWACSEPTYKVQNMREYEAAPKTKYIKCPVKL